MPSALAESIGQIDLAIIALIALSGMFLEFDLCLVNLSADFLI